MNIGGIFAVGGNNRLVHQLDDLAGSLINFVSHGFLFFLFKFDIRQHVKIFEGIIHRRFTGHLPVRVEKKPDKFLNILTDGHRKTDLAGLHQGLNIIGFIQVPGIINYDFDTFLVPTEWYPQLVEQKSFLETGQQFNRYRK